MQVPVSIVVSIPLCHTGDQGLIPRQGVFCQDYIIFDDQLLSLFGNFSSSEHVNRCFAFSSSLINIRSLLVYW